MKLYYLYALLFIIKSSFCQISLDLTSNIVPPGIGVHFGYFGDHGVYRMFHGEFTSLTHVVSGNYLLYQSKNGEELLVELFNKGDITIVLISSFSIVNDIYVFNNAMCFELNGNLISCITRTRLRKFCETPVNLLLDISSSRPNHPFINKTVERGVNSGLVTYEITPSYFGMKINPISTGHKRNYLIGPVYDSKIPVLVGYTAYVPMSHSSTKVRVQYGANPICVLINREDGSRYAFSIKSILGKFVWSAFIEEKYMPADWVHANETYKKLLIRKFVVEYLTLDLSNNITYEIYGMVKIAGTYKDWNYRMFEVNPTLNDLYNIVKVVDTEAVNIDIYSCGNNVVNTTVESYRNFDKLIHYVVITTITKVEYAYNREVRIFKGANNKKRTHYREVTQHKYDVLAMLNSFYGIRISMNIDYEIQPSIIGRERVANLPAVHYYFNQPDGRGMNLTGRYIFGDIYETESIPKIHMRFDPFVRSSQLLVSNIDVDEFILLRSTFESSKADVELVRNEYPNVLIIQKNT